MAARELKGREAGPRRRVVERAPGQARGRLFAGLNRCRRLANDWEKKISSAEAWITIALTRLVTRRLARYCYVS